MLLINFYRCTLLILLSCFLNGVSSHSLCAQEFKGFEHDFGVLPDKMESELLEHVFEIENNADQKLEITKVTESCSCIRVDGAAELSIEPNSIGKVKVLLDVSAQRGIVNQAVLLSSKDKTFRLRLTALKKGIWAAPVKADLGFVTGRKRLLSTIWLYESGFSKGKITSARSDNDAFEVLLGKFESNGNTEDGRGVGAIQIAFKNLDGSTKLGPQTAKVSVVFDCGDGTKRVVVIPVSSIVVSEHVVIPKAVFFGNVFLGTKVTRKLSFEPNGRSKSNQKKRSLKIESDSDYIAASITSDPKNKAKYDISIAVSLPVDAEFKGKLFRGNVRVMEQETVVVSIPYLAVVQPADPKLDGKKSSALKNVDSKKFVKNFDLPGVLSWFDSLTIPESAPAWTMAHYVLAVSESGGQKQKVVESLLNSGSKYPAFEKSNGRYFGASRGPFFETQHHPDQFLGYLSMSGVTTEEKLIPTKYGVTIADLLEHSKWNTTLRGEELSWKTIAYCNYEEKLGSQWKNKFSETICLETIVEKLISQDEPTCLGAHKVTAIFCYSNLLMNHRSKCSAGLKAKVEKLVKEKIKELKQTQRENGAFAVPKQLGDRRFTLDAGFDILNTGHTLEYLMLLETIDPNEPWVGRAANSLCQAIQQRHKRLESLDFENERYCREFGQLCHAISGLRRWSDKIR